MKNCKRCNELKQFKDYHPQPKNEDGYNDICRDCVMAYIQEIREKNDLGNFSDKTEGEDEYIVESKRAYRVHPDLFFGGKK